MANPHATDSQYPEEGHGFDYDLVVIGGGSGGLACSKAAAQLGKKVAVLDFVKPSPIGTTWGLGGTCVNVGCIPKKLMHQAALLGESLNDARAYGWEGIAEKAQFNWETLVQGVQDHIGSLNWGYRVDLRNNKVTYLNAYGVFLDPHTLETTDKAGKKGKITGRRFVIATGGRPKYPDIPGAKEYGITSDDLFSLPKAPGKTLVVGASYVALECAGFITGLGMDCTVMIRSIPLRGFDQQIAEMIVEYMEEHGTKFIRNSVPTSLEKEGDKIKVTWSRKMGDYDLGTATDTFDTVLFAIGREAETKNIGLDKIGIKTNPVGKIAVNKYEQTVVPHIYAIGDVLANNLELTPVAIQAGVLLARRLYGGSQKLMDYINVPTTVFTPLEYGCVGLSEDAAVEAYGLENLKIYHSYMTPLEWTVPHRPDNKCYMKLICNAQDNEKVLGFHVLGPNAGEITQAVAVAMRLGVTKQDFDDTVGIHPTLAEEMTLLSIDKASGKDAKKTGC
eukprot:GEZU01032599.1.p2 GENE.GEZU01032599.1~~GEZU01032599.1.p2  ORF type:complete len:504 (+),score=174.12 GEZU01032599.1:256-1767(+)